MMARNAKAARGVKSCGGLDAKTPSVAICSQCTAESRKITIMKWLLSLLAIPALLAQTTTFTATGPATTYAGQSVNATVSIAGSAGQGIAAAQWTFGLPTGFTLGAPTASAALVTLGDAAYCATAICLIAGSQSSVSDGALATVPIAIASTVAPSTISIPLSGLFAVTSGGLFVNGLVAGTPYLLKVLSRCDFAGSGTVNVADVQIAINAIIGTGVCPAIVGGSCTLQTVIYEIVAATGGACKL